MNKRKWAVLVATLSLLLCACGGETQYDRDFKSGMDKFNSGQKMTEGEYKAVKNYNNWKEKNSEKSYSDWDK